jgi:hypothetical protein
MAQGASLASRRSIRPQRLRARPWRVAPPAIHACAFTPTAPAGHRRLRAQDPGAGQMCTLCAIPVLIQIATPQRWPKSPRHPQRATMRGGGEALRNFAWHGSGGIERVSAQRACKRRA